MRIWIQGYGMETEPTKAMIKSVRRIPIFAILILSTFIILALFAEWVAPYSPTKINLTNRLLPPFWVENGSIDHLLGTDRIGRDILSRVIFGARISLTAGLVAVCIAAFVGTVRFWAPPKASTELLFHRPCLRCAGRYSIGSAIFEPVSGGPGHGT